jgi:uroporphyrinogen-III synthase
MMNLSGLRIMVPESRELDLFAAMLEAEGAIALRCPMVKILPLHDTAAADAWVDAAIRGDFDELILLTGEGLRHILIVAGARRDSLIAAMKRMRLTVRGPKPTRALREIGLSPDITSPSPTSEGVLETFGDGDLSGRRIGAQLYPGGGAEKMVGALRRRGAELFPVTPYRYASETETAQVAGFIRDLAMGSIDMIAFTASLQIERLMWVARESGLDGELKRGLSRTPIASVGPVVQDSLRKYGYEAAVQPENSYHLKPLVRAIAHWRHASIAREDRAARDRNRCRDDALQ